MCKDQTGREFSSSRNLEGANLAGYNERSPEGAQSAGETGMSVTLQVCGTSLVLLSVQLKNEGLEERELQAQAWSHLIGSLTFITVRRLAYSWG